MIKTYVILDVETTGLPNFGKYNLNPGLPKITEISLIAISSQHFVECEPGTTPRAQNKLIKVFNPLRFIGSSEKVTGLSNNLLDEHEAFGRKSCDLIKQFLLDLAQPVCLIAHNGYRHDFQLLQAHIKKFGMTLPENILCSDSLEAFRYLKVFSNSSLSLEVEHLPKLREQEDLSESLCSEINDVVEHSPRLREQEELIESLSSEINDIVEKVEHEYLDQLTDEFFAKLEKNLMETERSDEETDIVMQTGEENEHRNEIEGKNGVIFENNFQDKTPTRPILCNLSTPMRKKGSPRNLSNGDSGVRRQLFKTPTKIADLTPPYRLKNIYYHFFKKDIPNAHSAEGDCLALLDCLISVGPRNFNNWAIKNHKKFSSINKYW